MSLFTVIWMVIKQIIKNWKLEFILLLGLVLAVGVFSSISIYTDGVLQMMMTDSWLSASSPNYPPGTIKIVDDQWRDYHPILSQGRGRRDQQQAFLQYKNLDNYLQENLPRVYQTEQQYYGLMGNLEREAISPADGSEGLVNTYADIRFMENLEEQVEIIAGRWYEPDNNSDRVEVVIDENARSEMDMSVGDIVRYPLQTDSEQRKYLHLEVVGVYRVNQEAYNSPIWVRRPPFSESVFVSREKFEELVVREDTQPYRYEWYFLFDHQDIRFHEVSGMLQRLNRLETEMAGFSDNIRKTTNPLTVLSSVVDEAERLELLLLILSLPVMGIIFYYIILSARLTIQRRGNEIAMLRSRGAGILQIVFSYLIEWGLLGAAAFLIGPRLGLLIARVMGASSGFLEFVDRRPLAAIITPDARVFALYTVLAAVVSCLVLVIPASRQSIVSYKRNITRQQSKSVWQRYYLDFVFLLFSIFGYRVLQNQIEGIQEGTASASELILDPLLFLVPVLFIATAGLLSMRIIPWIFKFLSYLTNRLPEVTLSVTLKQYFRNSAQTTPLIFFIIMTVSLGIYASSIARTIDQNFVDSTYYEQGADAVLMAQWTFSSGRMLSPGGMRGGPGEEPEAPEIGEREISEPPFYVHKELTGVNDAARVFTQQTNFRIGGRRVSSGTLMGIDPEDFASVSWYRRDLTEYHLHHYLNLLLRSREAALVNREFFEENSLELGEWVTINHKGQEIDFYIAGIIDLWPSVSPQEFPLLVSNLDYIQSQYLLEPYEVWLDINQEASLQTIVNELAEEGIYVARIQDTESMIVSENREPQRMGLFGMLSIGFVVSALITVLGFFLYNFLSIKSRLLQFGIMRSLGLSLKQLISILSLEQILSVGIAFGLGTLFGTLTSVYFLPFLQISQQLAGTVPKFRPVVQSGDIMRILVLLGGALILSLIVLGIILVKLKLHEAIQLGEEV